MWIRTHKSENTATKIVITINIHVTITTLSQILNLLKNYNICLTLLTKPSSIYFGMTSLFNKQTT